MASKTQPLLRLQIAILLGVLSFSISATARPCKTLFVSSYSFSFNQPSIHHSDSHHFSDQDPSSGFVTIFTEIRPLKPIFINNNDKPTLAMEIFDDRSRLYQNFYDRSIEEGAGTQSRKSQLGPFGLSSYDFSSLRDRTKDILSVVVALLFGVGCGALTAATMYLVWSLFSNRYEYRSFDDYGNEDDNNEELDSPKKMGYVKIPAAESVPVTVASPAKEALSKVSFLLHCLPRA
ncbi:putative Transmembrane protein [Quillaja saponaria]|uniref:Transmembrane protein n=1 Tax=Quillaja saponaria TaxID=32244 RepID=A0AAD7PR19_QUISA|nr:putative Transmembrane protein [Quillaja saponaria]